MANVLGVVWKLDTTGTIVPAGNSVKIRGLRWVGATQIGHTCLVRDAQGRDIWESISGSSGTHIDADAVAKEINGFVLQTLSSGRLYVEV